MREIGQEARARAKKVDGAGKPFALGTVPRIPPKPGALQFGLHVGKQVVNRKFLQVLRVEPLEFGAVENAIGAADSGEREARDELRGGHEFFVAARGPSQKSEEIAKCLGQKPFFGVEANAGGSVALGEALAIRSENQRYMGEDRRRGGERMIEQHLFRRVRQMIGAANDVSDAHVDVVDHGAELISRQAGGTQKNEILNFLVLHFERAEDRVFETGHAFSRRSEANRVRRAFANLLFALRRGQISARARSAARSLFGSFVRLPRRHPHRRIAQPGKNTERQIRFSVAVQRRRDNLPAAAIENKALHPTRRRASAGPEKCLPRAPGGCARRRCPRLEE